MITEVIRHTNVDLKWMETPMYVFGDEWEFLKKWEKRKNKWELYYIDKSGMLR